MEQRRIIGYILLAVAAVICLASNVWFIVKMPAGGQKVEYLLLHALPEVIVVAAIAYNFAHPGRMVSKARISLTKPHVKRKAYYNIDPDGYRFVSHGATALLITMAFCLDAMQLLNQSPFNRIDASAAIFVLVLLTMAAIIWGEVKARIANPDL
ncbi:MAG: hypothetical protein IJ785_01295 [Bacteroidales bacterium]|nr:hypothetical protein [Bacteroidales bacterium]